MAIMREGEDRLTPDQFCYWFQGFAELHGQVPTPEQWDTIKRHLELVFRQVAKSPDEIVRDAATVIRDIHTQPPIRTPSWRRTSALRSARLSRNSLLLSLCMSWERSREHPTNLAERQDRRPPAPGGQGRWRKAATSRVIS